MGTSDLAEKLAWLLPLLPKPNAAQSEDCISDVETIYRQTAGLGDHLFDFDEQHVLELPQHQKKLYNALTYLHCICTLMGDIACDGLFSIFYNGTWDEINRHRTVLKANDETFSALFEEAFALAAPLQLQLPRNFVGRNRNQNPETVIGDEALDKLYKVEAQIELIRYASFEKALAAYQAAVTQAGSA